MMTMSSMVETLKGPISYQGYFGDKRLEARGTTLLANLIATGTVILNQLATTRAELVGASRFFDNDKVTVGALGKASDHAVPTECGRFESPGHTRHFGN